MNIRWLFVLLLPVSTLVCAVAPLSPGDELRSKLKAIETFEASFEQKLTDPSGEAIQTTRGRLVVKKPALFFWEVQPPYEQTVIANQDMLWVFDPDLEQVTISDREKLDNSPAQILSGDFSSLGDKYRVQVGHTQGHDVYTLEAQDSDVSTFTTIIFTFDKKGLLQSMILVDKLKQQTAVELQEQKLNEPVNDALFDFVPPDGTDIIRND